MSFRTGRRFCSVKESGVPQRILVLGASGYIGQHLIQALSQQGHEILAVARHLLVCKSSSCRG
jgi:NADPH:quinone reductase-like Zn-dependent oxidoreductase